MASENVEIKIVKNKMTITVDLSADLGVSASGKSRKIASTGGNVMYSTDVGDVKVGLNVYQSLPSKK